MRSVNDVTSRLEQENRGLQKRVPKKNNKKQKQPKANQSELVNYLMHLEIHTDMHLGICGRFWGSNDGDIVKKQVTARQLSPLGKTSGYLKKKNHKHRMLLGLVIIM